MPYRQAATRKDRFHDRHPRPAPAPHVPPAPQPFVPFDTTFGVARSGRRLRCALTAAQRAHRPARRADPVHRLHRGRRARSRRVPAERHAGPAVRRRRQLRGADGHRSRRAERRSGDRAARRSHPARWGDTGRDRVRHTPDLDRARHRRRCPRHRLQQRRPVEHVVPGRAVVPVPGRSCWWTRPVGSWSSRPRRAHAAGPTRAERRAGSLVRQRGQARGDPSRPARAGSPRPRSTPTVASSSPAPRRARTLGFDLLDHAILGDGGFDDSFGFSGSRCSISVRAPIRVRLRIDGTGRILVAGSAERSTTRSSRGRPAAARRPTGPGLRGRWRAPDEHRQAFGRHRITGLTALSDGRVAVGRTPSL